MRKLDDVPKVVDHERRREELADAALTIIARHGMRGVTTRAVAVEAGWSTGVLSHYFGNRNDLLLAALRRAAEVQGRIFREHRAQASDNVVERLRLLVESTLPLDERRVALTRIFAVFYAEVSVNPQAREEVADYQDNFRRMVERIMAAGQAEGAINADRDPATMAMDLVALADGLAVHAVIDPRIAERLAAEDKPGERIVREVVGLGARDPARVTARRSTASRQAVDQTTVTSLSAGAGVAPDREPFPPKNA